MRQDYACLQSATVIHFAARGIKRYSLAQKMNDGTIRILRGVGIGCLIPGVPVLLVTLFCALLWVRSYFVLDYMARWNHRPVADGWVVDHLHLNSGAGGLNLSSARDTPTNANEQKYTQERAGVEMYWQTNPKTHYPTLQKLEGRWGKMGFFSGSVPSNHSACGTRAGSEVLMPWWCPMLVLVLLTGILTSPYIVYVRRRRRANHTPDGICQPADGLPKPSV